MEGKASALVALGIATAPLDPDHARTLLVESAHLFAAIGDDWFEAIVLGSLGWLDAGRGDFTEELVFERAYLLARSMDDAIVTAHSGTNLAEMYLALGRLDDAREVLGVSLGAYEAVRLYDGLSYGLEAAAGIASSGGNAEEAARLLAAADGLRDEAGMPIWGARRTRFEALVTSARTRSATSSSTRPGRKVARSIMTERSQLRGVLWNRLPPASGPSPTDKLAGVGRAATSLLYLRVRARARERISPDFR